MKQFYIALTVVALLLLVLGMLYKKTRRSFFTEPMVAMFAGIIAGPDVLNLVNVEQWGGFVPTLEVASALAISMALMSAAYRLPKNFLKRSGQLQLKLLLLGMLGMCVLSTLTFKLILPFDWTYCLLMGAIITPTDPVIAATIVTGETAEELLPPRIRNTITFESAANDGLAFVFVMLPLMFITGKAHPMREWFLLSFLWKTCAAIIFGALIGYGAAKVFEKALSTKSIAKPGILVFSTALGFFVYGLLELIKCNGIIGVFAAGFVAHQVFNEDINREQGTEQEARERLFIIPIFFVFGLILPWHAWFNMGWKTVIAAVAILLFRRVPVVLAIQPWIRKSFSIPDALFVGWFGPIGAAAMFYAVYTYGQTNNPDVWTVVSMVIFTSTITHGVTANIFSKKYQQATAKGDKVKEVASHVMT